MEELLEDLRDVLEKHSAHIFLTEEEGFLILDLLIDKEEVSLDSGYRDLLVSPETLQRNINDLEK